MAHPTQSLCTLRARRRRRPRNTRYRAPATAYPHRSLTGRTTPAFLAHKQSILPQKESMDCFVASLLAMTLNPDTRSRPRGAMRPSCAFISRPHGGRGECRAPAAPAASCAILVESTRVTTSTPASPGIPARNGFTAYVALSPVTGLFCHRRQRISDLSAPGWADLPSRELDASVGASGPHDFAVRESIFRQRAVDRSQVPQNPPSHPIDRQRLPRP